MMTVFAVVSCTDDYKQLEPAPSSLTSFSEIVATIAEDADTRVYLDESRTHLFWFDNESVGVYSDTQGIEEYRRTSIVNEDGTVFTGKEIGGNQFYAFYPYDTYKYNTFIDNERKLHITLPDGDSFRDTNSQRFWLYNKERGSEGNINFTYPYMAMGNSNIFRFKHVLGYLHISIEPADVMVFNDELGRPDGFVLRRVILKGNNGETLAGNGIVDLSSSEPIFTFDESSDNLSKTITMGPNGFSYPTSGRLEQCREVFFAVPPMTFEKGITLEFEFAYIDASIEVSDPYNAFSRGEYEFRYVEVSTDKPVTINRGKIKPMEVLNGEELFEKAEAKVDETDIKQRTALKAFYDALGGDNWKNKTNWNTDAPLSEWYGLTVENGLVTELVLTSNNLVGDVPENICELEGLKLLHLYNNKVTSIPDAISKLPLTTLYLNQNQISSLPKTIGDMKSLRNLSLSGNWSLVELPEEISKLSNLCEISFGSYIDYPDWFFTWLSQLTNLERLNLGYGLTEVPEAIRQLKNLDFLSLSGNQIEEVPDWLSELTNLRVIWMDNNKLKGKLSDYCFDQMSNLTVLSLTSNQLEGDIPDSYFTNLFNLSSFYITSNKLSGTITKEQQESPMWQNLQNKQINPQQKGYGIALEGGGIVAISLNVDSDILELNIGDTFQLKATTIPAEETSKLKWVIAGGKIWDNDKGGYVMWDPKDVDNAPFTLDENHVITALRKGGGEIQVRTTDGSGVMTGIFVSVGF